MKVPFTKDFSSEKEYLNAIHQYYKPRPTDHISEANYLADLQRWIEENPNKEQKKER